jgi:hypothetical protein
MQRRKQRNVPDDIRLKYTSSGDPFFFYVHRTDLAVTIESDFPGAAIKARSARMSRPTATAVLIHLRT